MASIYKHTLGTPEKIVPSKYKCPSKTVLSDSCSYPIDRIKFKTTAAGCSIELPLSDEEIFSFGLQLKSVCHRGTKKTMRPNADPLSDSGDSHAPVPFFVTNRGYGIYLDTARYVSFYCGASHVHAHIARDIKIATATEELYAARKNEESVMLIDIPAAKGVDLYIIEGSGIIDIISEYNMLSGGGKILVGTDNIPVFVKDNSIIPRAEPMEYIADDAVFEITLKCFGEKGETALIQDDGITNDTQYKAEKLAFDGNKIIGELSEQGRYRIIGTEFRD